MSFISTVNATFYYLCIIYGMLGMLMFLWYLCMCCWIFTKPLQCRLGKRSADL